MNTEIRMKIALIKYIKQSVSRNLIDKDSLRFIQFVTDLINALEKLDTNEEEPPYYDKESYMQGYQCEDDLK